MVTLVLDRRFVYGKTMSASDTDLAVSEIAAAIGEPSRARILVSLLDGRPRTGAELAAVAGISASTASVHLHRLRAVHLIQARRDGKHCYYDLTGSEVARVLKQLSSFGTRADTQFSIEDCNESGAGRCCYDHMAGGIGMALHDGYLASGWLTVKGRKRDVIYALTAKGAAGFRAMEIHVGATEGLRRRFVYGCPDWREGKRHLAGALGAALMQAALSRGWVVPTGIVRGLRLTELGRRMLLGAKD
jgi:DNA-binding transcriptional ArsR family regulator